MKHKVLTFLITSFALSSFAATQSIDDKVGQLSISSGSDTYEFSKDISSISNIYIVNANPTIQGASTTTKMTITGSRTTESATTGDIQLAGNDAGTVEKMTEYTTTFKTGTYNFEGSVFQINTGVNSQYYTGNKIEDRYIKKTLTFDSDTIVNFNATKTYIFAHLNSGTTPYFPIVYNRQVINFDGTVNTINADVESMYLYDVSLNIKGTFNLGSGLIVSKNTVKITTSGAGELASSSSSSYIKLKKDSTLILEGGTGTFNISNNMRIGGNGSTLKLVGNEILKNYNMNAQVKWTPVVSLYNYKNTTLAVEGMQTFAQFNWTKSATNQTAETDALILDFGKGIDSTIIINTLMGLPSSSFITELEGSDYFIRICLKNFDEEDTLVIKNLNASTDFTADMLKHFYADGYDLSYDVATESIIATAQVPEPSTYAMMFGAIALVFALRKRVRA